MGFYKSDTFILSIKFLAMDLFKEPIFTHPFGLLPYWVVADRTIPGDESAVSKVLTDKKQITIKLNVNHFNRNEIKVNELLFEAISDI